MNWVARNGLRLLWIDLWAMVAVFVVVLIVGLMA